MATEEELLQRILANPDDDDVRAIYADQRIAEGDPRGTFINHQLRLAQMTGLEEDFPELVRSTDRLEAAHVFDWLTPLFPKLGVDPNHYSRIELSPTRNALFRRGFLHSIAMRKHP